MEQVDIEKPQIEDAIAYLSKVEPHWSVLVGYIRDQRESCIADLKRNMHTPQCNNRADEKIIGSMITYDDILWLLAVDSES